MPRLGEKSGPITIREVAKQAGVSVATASYALNNSGRVASATRDRVLLTASELGYAPSLAARSLKGGKGRVIAILTHGMGGPWYGEIMEGLQVGLNDAGYPVIAITVQDGALSLCRSLIADGIILGVVVLNPGVVDTRFLRAILESVPSVIYGGDLTLRDSQGFAIDNIGGERLLVEHLWSRGYRDFAWIDGQLETSGDARQRWDSFAAAIGAHGGSPATITRLRADFGAAPAEQQVTALLAGGARPRAIVAANDESAIGALAAIKKLGLRVPADIAVAGFDGIESSRWTDPPLTTLYFNRHGLGRQMALSLVRLINKGTASDQPEMIPVSLEVRGST